MTVLMIAEKRLIRPTIKQGTAHAQSHINHFL